MKLKAMAVMGLAVAISLGSACATKKYVRNRVNERVTPLENRAGELEETSRRNTQDISRISREVEDVRLRADRAQQSADRAASSAEQANTRVSGVEQSISDLRTSLDKYTVQKTVSVLFKVARSELTPEATSALDEIAGQIRDRNGFLLEIEGFASADGDTAYNDRLSQARSESVRRYLAERHSIPVFRMYILGFGESRPVADNTTIEGRTQNRRVEVRLLTNNAVSQ
ncbi:MAG TPA: OmpA family protein [Blastocatellia bacterium]|jgi:outer membrane protein OmpA-like peptidoglycan-associated protein|nr:OmpA family protein [Blastocatellia bacterium]